MNNNNQKNDEFLRKRRERQRRKKQKRARIIFIFFLVLLVAIGAILSVTVLFPIKKITAKGSKIYSEEQIVNACGIKSGDNLIVVSQDKALENLKKTLPFIQSIEFDRSFPDTLKIKVTDAKEKICYIVNDKYYTVSEDGWVLNSYDKRPKALTLIISDGIKCKVGSKLEITDKNIKELYAKIDDTLKYYKLKADYINLTDRLQIKVKVENRFIVNLGSSKDMEPKIKHLKAMLQKSGKDVVGNINLSMWSRNNPQGSLKELEKLKVQITDELNIHKLKVDYVDINDKSAVKAKVEGRFIVNFGTSSDLEAKVKYLNTMIKKINKSDKGNIDLSIWSAKKPQGNFIKTDENYTKITDTLDGYGYKYDNIDISDKTALTVRVNERLTVNFGTSENLESKLQKLKEMIEEISKEDSGNIDLSMWSSQNPQGIFTKIERK